MSKPFEPIEGIEEWCRALVPGLTAMIDICYRRCENDAKLLDCENDMQLAKLLGHAVGHLLKSSRKAEDNEPEMERAISAVFILCGAALLRQNKILEAPDRLPPEWEPQAH